MAARLVRAGFPVVVHNRSPAAVDELAAEGAESAGSPREIAERSDVVVTMLPDSPDVEAVVLGEDSVVASCGRACWWSTCRPSHLRRHAGVHAALAERRVEAVDAPVSGGEPAAVDGQLSIMAGGSEAAVKRAEPIFAELGKATTHIGPPGAGQVAKAANQVVVALTIQAVAEALTLAVEGRSRSRARARGAAGRLRAVEDPRGSRGAHARGPLRSRLPDRVAPQGPGDRAAVRARGRRGAAWPPPRWPSCSTR